MNGCGIPRNENVPPPAVRQAHQCWQIDGKEKVGVGDHDVTTIMNLRDPAALMIGSRAIVTTTE